MIVVAKYLDIDKDVNLPTPKDTWEFLVNRKKEIKEYLATKGITEMKLGKYNIKVEINNLITDCTNDIKIVKSTINNFTIFENNPDGTRKDTVVKKKFRIGPNQSLENVLAVYKTVVRELKKLSIS